MASNLVISPCGVVQIEHQVVKLNNNTGFPVRSRSRNIPDVETSRNGMMFPVVYPGLHHPMPVQYSIYNEQSCQEAGPRNGTTKE